MRKYIIYFFICLYYTNSFSQLGINTNLPLGIFHIKGKENNLSENSVLVTSEGNLGIGTHTPTNKLFINNSNSTGLTLSTGAKEGKVLVSDDNGNAYWSEVKMKRFRGTIDRVHNPNGLNIMFTEKNFLYTGWSITLPPGKWLVKVAMYMLINPAKQLNTDEYVQLNATFMDSNDPSSSPSLDIIKGESAYGIIYGQSVQRTMLLGNMIIENKNLQDKKYYFFAGNITTNVVSTPQKPNLINNFTGKWGEDYIFATPIN